MAAAQAAHLQEVQNLEGLGANFATQFCWAGMYGGQVQQTSPGKLG